MKQTTIKDRLIEARIEIEIGTPNRAWEILEEIIEEMIENKELWNDIEEVRYEYRYKK